MTYSMTVAGLQRELPICKVADDLYIGAFICFGDAELTVACARDLLKLVENEEYDYLFTAEAKSPAGANRLRRCHAVPCPGH